MFRNDTIKTLIEDLVDVVGSRGLLRKRIGDELARSVKRRLDQIKSFTNFQAFIDGGIDSTESLKGNFKGYYSMTLNKNYRIVVSPDAEDMSPENLKRITSFYLVGVIDYHGEGNKKSSWLIK